MKENKTLRTWAPVGILSMILILSLLVGAVSCNSNTSTNSITPSTTIPATNPATTTSTANEPTITLTYTEHDTANSWWVTEIIEPWFIELEQVSNGRIKIERHYGGELFGIFDAYDAAAKGSVDMAYFFPSMVAGRFVIDDIATLGSCNKLNWRPGTTYWELVQKFPEIQNEFDGTHLLSAGQFLGPYFGTTKKAIRSFDDMKGLQFLATGDLGAKRISAWGAIPANVPPPDLFSSLQKGVLDCTAVSLNTLDGMSLGDVIKYLTRVNLGQPNFAIVINESKWNSLSPDIQKILTDEGIKLVDEVQVNAENGFRQQAIDKYKIELIDLPQAELDKFEAASAPVRAEYAASLDAKGLPGTKVLEAFLQIEAKYSTSQYAPK
jgi:TRAP-type C4-dicarboxylate transport system substrate-binding protein